MSLAPPLLDRKTATLPSRPATGLLQRRCACGGTPGPDGECAACKAKRLAMQRRAADHGGFAAAPPIVHDVLRAPGRPLDAATRAHFEPRFGHDFSRVRVHADDRAAASARAVDALAYTVGNGVVFDRGRYQPASADGRRLLAHELTHVVQQQGQAGGPLAIEPANSAHEREADAAAASLSRPTTLVPASAHSSGPVLARQTGRAGTSTFVEPPNLQVPATQGPPGVWTGTVVRQETRPAAQAGQPPQVIDQGWSRVRFDANSCQVTVPMTVRFRAATAADIATCPPSGGAGGTLPALPPIAASDVTAAGRQYVNAVNQRLNGWFTLRFGACQGLSCAGRDVPITVQVTQSTSNPDYDVAIANLSGRSCVSASTTASGQPAGAGMVLLYRRDLDQTTMAHEGGHMALGVGDEYRETNPANWAFGIAERVREGDWSLMAEEAAYGNWSLLHQRHFQFVPGFVNRVLQSTGHPGCTASLQEIPRPTTLSIHLPVNVGYANLAGTGMYNVGGGIELGIAPTRQRDWELLVGAHLNLLTSVDGEQRSALLLGMRVGFEHTAHPSAGGLRLGAYAEGGAGSFTTPTSPSRWSPYGELGGSIGYSAPPTAHIVPYVGVEAAAGTGLDLGDPNNQQWFRVGVVFGGRFH